MSAATAGASAAVMYGTRRQYSGGASVVLLAAAPLLRDGEVLVQDVRGDVVQVLLLHGAHLREEVRALDGWVHLRDVLQPVVGRRRVQVVHQALDGVPGRQGAGELLEGQG